MKEADYLIEIRKLAQPRLSSERKWDIYSPPIKIDDLIDESFRDLMQRDKFFTARYCEIGKGTPPLYLDKLNITLQDVAKIILGSIITIGGFYSLTVILFTL